MEFLKLVKSIEDFEVFLKLKSQKDAIIWSGFLEAPDPIRFKQYFINTFLEKEINLLFYLKDDMNDDVIGYIQLEKKTDLIAEVHGSALFKKYQGIGLASVLDSLLVKKAEEMGFLKLYTWASEQNAPSIKALLDAGFCKMPDFEYRRILGINHKFYKWTIDL